MLKHSGRCLIFLLGLLIPFVCKAQTEAGKVIIVKGDVVAVADQKERPLARGSAIYEGETIKTKGDAAAQLRMIDGARMSLLADTEFKIDQYAYKQVGKPDTSVTTLVKGGFKTVTGDIPKHNVGGYQAKTAIATMGLRGTSYASGICGAGDVATFGCVLGSQLVNVYNGVVVIKNDVSTIEIGSGKTFHNAVVFTRDQPIRGMNQPSGLLSSARMTGATEMFYASSGSGTPGMEADMTTGPSTAQTAAPPGQPLKIQNAVILPGNTTCMCGCCPCNPC